MTGFYGARFADAWRGCDPAVVRATWAEELAGFTVAELRRGIDGLRTRDFPPTLPEFLRLCRPPLDADTAFVEAVREMRKRVENGSDTWSRPEIFWAASSIGFYDLTTQPYRAMERRWRTALANAKSDPIPVRLVELPRRGDVRANPEHVRQVFADVDARLREAPSALPDDWTLPQPWREFCIKVRPDLNPDVVAAKFAAHWHSAPMVPGNGLKKNWERAWQNWVERENASTLASGRAVMFANPTPTWATAAGFPNRFEAENAGCYEHTARQFRDGRRIEKSAADEEVAAAMADVARREAERLAATKNSQT